ncbi:unnamed protein product [Protopolystoma xenopodis]|uniref:Uncharacterized protein n=1 Tax=Protopolystoma xenopodis TaxID=117903 RepID=A0A3S4ZLF0_9PLAT|nr:unnamed protein product [Protopolystoma xenopodis]
MPSSELADLSPHEAIMYARIMRQYKQPRTAQNLKRQQAQNSPLSQSNSLRQQILPQTFQVEHINQLGISIKGQDLRSAHSIVATRSRPPYQQQLQRHPTYANTSPLTVDSFSSGGVNDTTLLLDKASLKPRLSSAQQNEPGTNLRQTHSRSFLQSEQRQPQSYQLTRK